MQHNQPQTHMAKYGLIGKNINYSFSRTYFKDKFEKGDIDAEYVNFDCNSISEVFELLERDYDTQGFNVTIPYK